MFPTELHLLQPRELAQARVEDGLGLDLAELEGRDQLLLRLVLVADDADHLVEVEVGDPEAVEDVEAGLDLGQPVAGAADQHIAAMVEEGQQHLLQPHDAGRAAGVEDVEVDAEAVLQVRELEQALHQDGGLDVARLGLQHQAHVLGALVADVAQQRQALVLDQLGQLLDQVGLLHLVGDLGDDDLVPALAQVLLRPERAQAHPAPAGLVGLQQRACRLDDHPAGGEVGALHMGHQVGRRAVRLFEQKQTGVDQLAGVVRRDRGRHADGDAGGAVGQQVGIAGGQDDGLGVLAVVGRLEVDGVLVDALQQERGGFRQAGLGVAHGGGVIAVDVAEVALAVDQRIALGEVLGHADQRVVDRLVAVRVIAAHHLAHHLGAFAGAGVGVQPHLAHGVEHASLHGLEAIAHVRKRPVGDDAERIGQVAAAERLGQRLVDDPVAGRRCGGGVGHGESRGEICPTLRRRLRRVAAHPGPSTSRSSWPGLSGPTHRRRRRGFTWVVPCLWVTRTSRVITD